MTQQSRETHRVQFRVPGGVWVWVKGTSQTMDPSQASRFASKEEAEQVAARLQGPRSSLQARVVRYTPNDSYSPFAEHERLHGGRADYREPSEFDPAELERGIQHEMEHTDDPDVAREIAMDHLAEDEAYYTHLDAMEQGSFLSNTTKTRYIGFCPVCEGEFKCQSFRGKQLLVHHGYKRPGHGNIEGDCFGVGREPHEVSPQLAIDYRDALMFQLNNLREAHANLPNVTSLKFMNWRTRKAETVTPADPSWWRHFEEHKSSLEYRLRETERDVRRMERHVDTWKPLPLKTVEEEMEELARARRQRSEAVATERAQRRADQITKTQARIDAAVRNQNLSTLGDIYSSAYSGALHDKLRAPAHEILQLLDRDHVWSALGLMLDGRYLEPGRWARDPADQTPARRVLEALRDSRYDLEMDRRPAILWPSELGAPKGKWKKWVGPVPNASHYVWVLGADGLPLQTEGPHGPHDLEGAKTFARIGATEGVHDRAVSRGKDPESASFEIVRIYRAGSGERRV